MLGYLPFYERINPISREMGAANSQNYRIWTTSNPHECAEVSMQPAKVTVWCEFTASFIIDQFFFDERCATVLKTCTITSARY